MKKVTLFVLSVTLFFSTAVVADESLAQEPAIEQAPEKVVPAPKDIKRFNGQYKISGMSGTYTIDGNNADISYKCGEKVKISDTRSGNIDISGPHWLISLRDYVYEDSDGSPLSDLLRNSGNTKSTSELKRLTNITREYADYYFDSLEMLGEGKILINIKEKYDKGVEVYMDIYCEYEKIN